MATLPLLLPPCPGQESSLAGGGVTAGADTLTEAGEGSDVGQPLPATEVPPPTVREDLADEAGTVLRVFHLQLWHKFLTRRSPDEQD